MTLRARVTVAAGLAVLLAVIAVSITVYLVVRRDLYDQIDDSLLSHAARAHTGDTHATTNELPDVGYGFAQLVDADGNVVGGGDIPLPVTPEVIAVARADRSRALFTAAVDGESYRILATPQGDDTALEIGRPLAETEDTLRRLLVALVAISAAAVALAAIGGRIVAAAAVRPVHQVVTAAETVAATRDFSHHLEVTRRDELGRLAASFNQMIAAVEDSLTQQRQLVADASHELRTPLATVRTNVEVLARAGEMDPDERSQLIRDTVSQLGELTRLVEDLVELARGDVQHESFASIDLYALTREAVETSARRHPDIAFRIDGGPCVVRAEPTRLTRALTNLLDNAAKWSPPGSDVTVTVGDGTVTVVDEGPGIPADDRPHVFDRFYRAAAARAMPGSGLGLAIVKQVADSHGGSVDITSSNDRGTSISLTLPVTREATGDGQP
jgi:two-component system sensor histidine kinase MprB